MPDVNIWAVVVATLSTLIVGSVWYHPRVFGERWMELADVDRQQAEESGAVVPIIVTVIVSFVTSYVLAALGTMTQAFYGGNFLTNVLLIGIVTWAGFTAARIITHDAFEGRPTSLTTMNIAHELTTVVVMALVIGAFGSPL